MDFRLPVRLIALSAALLALPAVPASAQQPQKPGVVKSNHGAWSIVCDKPAGSAEEQCALMQNVIADDRPEVGL